MTRLGVDDKKWILSFFTRLHVMPWKVLNRFGIGDVVIQSRNQFINAIPFRTHIRNWSLRFTASDQQENVNKGSRQIRPVTLGKGLALMVECEVFLYMIFILKSWRKLIIFCILICINKIKYEVDWKWSWVFKVWLKDQISLYCLQLN